LRSEAEDTRRTTLLSAQSKGADDFLIKFPTLLCSLRAHVQRITAIVYLSDTEMVITSAVDSNIRVFTLAGRLVGFFGQESQWDLLALSRNRTA
jgi:hypothetical protein